MSSDAPPRLWRRVFLLPWLLIRPVLYWFGGAPRWMQAGLVLSLGVLFVFGGWAGVRKLTKRQQAQAVQQGWKDFERAVSTSQIPEMRQSLEAVLQVEPENLLAAQRLQALESLEADPGDEAMVFLTMRLALQQQKMPEAAREARKRLEGHPKDWLARCVLALDRLVSGDLDGTREQLDQLPDPAQPVAQVQPAGLLMAFRLFRAVNRDLTPLQRFVETHVAQVIRNPNVETLPAGEKLSLIECLLEGLNPRQDRLPTAIVQSWAAVNNLLNSSLEQYLAEEDLPGLIRLGQQSVKLALFLQLLQRDNAMSGERAQEASVELESRTQRIWTEVQRLDPARSESYLGLSLSFLRQNQYKSAREVVTRGLSVVGLEAELLKLFSRMLQLEGQSDAAYASLMAAAEEQPERALNWWGLAAEAAITGHRRDLALEACQKMRQREPRHAWAIRTEAILWLEAEQPQKALQLLEPFAADELLRQPILARAYTRARVQAEQLPEVEELLARAQEQSRQTRQPSTVHAVLLGWLDAAQKQKRGDWAQTIAEQAERLLELWPEEVPLMRLRAEARYCAAEHHEPAWPLDRVRSAIQANERLRAARPEEPATGFTLAKLQLLGEQNAAQALREIKSQAEPDQWPQLSADQLTLLGQVFRRNNQFDQAVQALELASRSREATAGTFIQLAWTLHQMGRRSEARSTLAIAQPMPRTPQEQADYVAAAQLIVP